MLKKINKLVNIGLRLRDNFLIIILLFPCFSYAKYLNITEVSVSKCKKLSDRNIIKIESKLAKIVYIKKDDIYHHLLICGLSVGKAHIKIWRADNWEMETLIVQVNPLKKPQAKAANRNYDKNYPKNEFLLEKKIAGWDPSYK